uniref:Lipoxygenase domain-containing protein n=1 Tax=Taeniopygia guttata TaxID=59729 RepID=A0A674HAF5_TAEGU
MAEYRLRVRTGSEPGAGTSDAIAVTLLGSRGRSARTALDRWGPDFQCGAVREGRGRAGSGGDPDDVAELGPFHFPCYRWLQGYGTWELPEGTGGDTWDTWGTSGDSWGHLGTAGDTWGHLGTPGDSWGTPGVPGSCPRAQVGTPGTPGDTPGDSDFGDPKTFWGYQGGSWGCLSSWGVAWGMSPSVPNVPNVPPVSPEYVVRHWQEDAFFGEQFLSGVNPVLLRRCRRLPPNFPVSEAVVAPSLGPATSLRREMEAGNIYLADYGVLQGIPTALIDGRPTFVAAPLCLLHQRPNGDLLPLAIQLSQEPGPSAPLFVPQDPPWLWALAKVWVRSAEFQVHEALTHLLRSHLLGEVFALATLRRLPPQHPLFKLLVPHTRFTVQIGALARRFLLNPGGVFDRAVALGRRGLLALVARGLRALRWRSLVLPRDLRHRGVAATKCHHFGCDATKVWRAIRRFVTSLLSLYYPADGAVAQDSELQEWVREIFRRAFLGRPRSGVPSRLETRRDLVTFVTAVIFNCSALHAATNSGQFELSAFPPNAPAAMREPPPTCKAALSEQEFLAALPAMNTTATVLAVLWVLRNEPMDMRPLGHYPERHFTESAPRRLIRRFRRRLRRISRQIRARNAALERPYPYLDPENIENSVAI